MKDELKIIISAADFERVCAGKQDEIYLPIDQKYSRIFINQDGRRGLLVSMKKGNALINAALDAWRLGYAEKVSSVTLQRGVSKQRIRINVQNILIRTGRAEWCDDTSVLRYVVRLGDIIEK